jgi:hypothetical protein
MVWFWCVLINYVDQKMIGFTISFTPCHICAYPLCSHTHAAARYNQICSQTQVTNFLTNGLFGKGRKWNGKLFDGHDGRGRNRFFSSSKTTNEQIHPVSSESTTIDTEHTFDLSVAPSRLGVSIKEELQDNDNSNTDSNSNQATPHEMMKVALCDYTQHQSRFSLWYSMKDELRVVKCSNGQIVLGLGSMGWSGSIWNASPFCLWRETSDPASSTDADEAVSS